jgi:outer membrane receptor protein involved in Fe transport
MARIIILAFSEKPGRTALIAALILALAASSISGVVHDVSGGVVSGAAVIVRVGSGPEQRVTTGPDGRFSVDVSENREATIIVRAGGFAEKQERVTDMTRPLQIVLAPAQLLEQVTVTASRTEQRLGDVPASINVLHADEIRNSPAVVADDVLRQIPTFSLFRRTSSLSSHPTAQGVSLRGIGPSGVSRTLVLVDGAPFNDPFGGWVYWTRVPLESVDRIEVVDGSSSSLYGNYAMGGVINIVTSRAARRTFEIKPQYGNHSSPKLDYSASDVWGKLGVTVDGSVFNTDGFPIVVANERGIIDNNATVKFRNFNGKVDYRPTDRLQAFVRAGYFAEDRGNGKILEVNDTRWKSTSGGLRVRMPDESDLQVSVNSDFSDFHSTFLAVTAPSATVAPRSIVRLTIDQVVPTKAVGTVVQWAKALGTKQYFSAGTDWHWVEGESQEASYNAAPGPVVPPVQNAILALNRASGGTQRSIGAFVQDILTPLPQLTVTIGGRVDQWRNYNAHNLETSVPSGAPTANNRLLPDRDDTVFSPRIAAMYHLTDRINLWGDISSGFRAPTLNELYRQFRVGTVLTLANDQLGPERLVGGEFGVNIAPRRDLTWRTTWFDNRVKNPVGNITQSVTPAQTTQQRQNLGRTEIWGIQTDVEYRLGSAFRVAGAYLYNQATVKEYSVNPLLVDKFLPQVPKHRGSVQASWANPRYASVAFAVQFLGTQFDDDQNVRIVPGQTEPGLPGYALADFTASRTVNRNLDVFFGVQNIFDQQYFVGTLPTTIGSPRLVNGGVRIRFVGRTAP